MIRKTYGVLFSIFPLHAHSLLDIRKKKLEVGKWAHINRDRKINRWVLVKIIEVGFCMHPCFIPHYQ